jgi:hypothetical protein
VIQSAQEHQSAQRAGATAATSLRRATSIRSAALIEKYLNIPQVFEALGVPKNHVKTFNVSSAAISFAFQQRNYHGRGRLSPGRSRS